MKLAELGRKKVLILGFARVGVYNKRYEKFDVKFVGKHSGAGIGHVAVSWRYGRESSGKSLWKSATGILILPRAMAITKR